MTKKILVLCTGNSCRSQIAEGYLRHFANGNAEVYSAGVETHGVNPKAIAIMQEDGIDISNHTSNNIDEYYDIDFDFVITVCDNAKERCPFFPTKAKKFHHNFSDPAKAKGTDQEINEQFREVRQQIKEYCERFIAENLKGNKHLLSETILTAIEKQLNPADFFRINRGELIQKKYIEKIERYNKNSLSIKLKGYNNYVKTSQSQTTLFREWMEK